VHDKATKESQAIVGRARAYNGIRGRSTRKFRKLQARGRLEGRCHGLSPERDDLQAAGANPPASFVLGDKLGLFEVDGMVDAIGLVDGADVDDCEEFGERDTDGADVDNCEGIDVRDTDAIVVNQKETQEMQWAETRR